MMKKSKKLREEVVNNMVNKIVELDDNKNYVLLDETVLNGVKYYFGLRLNKNVKGSFVAHYISCIVNANFFGKTYSDLIDIIFSNIFSTALIGDFTLP